MHSRPPVYSPILSRTVARAPGQSAGCPAGAQVGTGGALLRQTAVLCWAAGAGQVWEPAAGASASLAVLGAGRGLESEPVLLQKEGKLMSLLSKLLSRCLPSASL